MNYIKRNTKRIFDITVVLFCMVVFLPLYLVCYLAIFIDDGHPVLFSQERIGYKGKVFKIYKFRTMRRDAEDMGPMLSNDNDIRLTRVGAYLRKHHLDELPQLWNVLKGDMSFVGPRPERKYFIDKIMRENSDYELLFQIRPGITSMATIYNGYTDTMEKMLIRLQMDLDYLGKRSLWYDAKIIFTTVRLLANGKKI